MTVKAGTWEARRTFTVQLNELLFQYTSASYWYVRDNGSVRIDDEFISKPLLIADEAEDAMQRLEIGKDKIEDGAEIRIMADKSTIPREDYKDDNLLEGIDREKASDGTDVATCKEEDNDMEKETTLTAEGSSPLS